MGSDAPKPGSSTRTLWTECLSRERVKVYKQYLPFDRIKTCREMSDLLWEMQGELKYLIVTKCLATTPNVSHHPIGRLQSNE